MDTQLNAPPTLPVLARAEASDLGASPSGVDPATPRCNLLLNHAKKDAPVDLRAFPWSLWPSLADAIDTPYRLLQDAQQFRPADESR